MRKLFLALALLGLFLLPGASKPAAAQTVNLWCYTGPTNPQWQPCSTANPLPVTDTNSANITNPPTTLTRPANTTAYALNNLIASSTTAGSIVVPSFAIAIANSAGGAIIPRVRLTTNITTGWGTAVIRVRLWTAAPTYTNGDGGAYAVATGGATFLGQYDVSLTQYGDAASGAAAIGNGNFLAVNLASGNSIFWDLQDISGALTPISGQTFTLTPEILN